MKVVLLCGGLGTRLREETEFRPKSMVEVGGKPLLWWIMKHYAKYGFNEFVICLGYKGDYIRDYFLNYDNRNCDFTIHLGSGRYDVHDKSDEHNWKVTLAETGDNTLTGGRLYKVAKYIDGSFMLTYGDGLSNVDINKLLTCHRESKNLATLTAVKNISRFGEISIDSEGLVYDFKEKASESLDYINGGFFVFEPEVFNYFGCGLENMPLETGLLETLTKDCELNSYKHDSWWMCIDTYRELQLANELYSAGKLPL